MDSKIYKLILEKRRKDVFNFLKKIGCAFKLVDEVSIDDLIIDQGIYPREKTDWERVEMYAENLENGATFPPIIIAEREKDFAKIILDGNHRFYAYKKLGFETIPAEIWEVPESLYPVVAQAVNTEEKETDTPLTPTEKKKAILRDWEILTQYNKEERKKLIAEAVKTTVGYVEYVLSTAGVIRSEKEEKKKRAEELRKQGYTYKQISEELGIPERTLKRWLSEKVPKFSQLKNDTPEEDLPTPEEAYTPSTEFRIITEEEAEEIAERVVSGTSEETEEEKPKKKVSPNVGRPKDTTKFNFYEQKLAHIAKLLYEANWLALKVDKEFALKILLNTAYLIKHDISIPPVEILHEKEYWKEINPEFIEEE